jgi:hypothetical protein
MLKLLNRQAFKALRNPFRGPLQTRHVHSAPALPFSGPASYATLERRFSDSSPNPISFFAQKAAKEAAERGEFVDVHDIGDVDPKDYDVLITDVNNNTLHSEISELAGIPYLKETTKDEADKVVRELPAFLYGERFRMILPCVVIVDDKARWVFFIVNTGSPLTYISGHVSIH